MEWLKSKRREDTKIPFRDPGDTAEGDKIAENQT